MVQNGDLVQDSRFKIFIHSNHLPWNGVHCPRGGSTILSSFISSFQITQSFSFAFLSSASGILLRTPYVPFPHIHPNTLLVFPVFVFLAIASQAHFFTIYYGQDNLYSPAAKQGFWVQPCTRVPTMGFCRFCIPGPSTSRIRVMPSWHH